MVNDLNIGNPKINDPKVIVALDYPVGEGALAIAQKLDPALCRLKVGKELFTSEGPVIVDALHKLGFEIFLDLKFHDIPNTVAKAVNAAADMGVWMVNVHASGGRRMMDASREILEQRSGSVPRLIAVTVLTSMEEIDLEEVGLELKPTNQVARLAKLTKQCGLDGVVCSAKEVPLLREIIENPFTLVTPGIRPRGSQQNDQRRVVTPSEAIDKGSDYLVVGRPVTKAEDPVFVLNAINTEISRSIAG